MIKQVVIRIEEGSFESGFPVSLKISEDGQTIAEEFDLKLPPNPDLPKVYDKWRNIYTKLEKVRGIEFPKAQITNSSILEDCQNAARFLEDNENEWFRQPEFGAITAKIVKILKDGTPNKSVRVIIDTSNPYLRKLSWDSWDLFQEQGFFPQAEFALFSQYYRPKKTWQKPIRILAIFGSNEGGLQLEEDRKMIENLKRYGVSIYSIPAIGNSLTQRELFETLCQGNWDIIFYTGHSSGRTLQLDRALKVSVYNLRGALRETAPTLKLAIFNSCDGLDIAQDLADFNIPNMIVMRELVPDQVARSFLKYFLKGFTKGNPLSVSVTKARRRLQKLEFPDSDGLFYPRASKIPVLIQNPNTPELYWPWGVIPLIRQIIDILRTASKILTWPFRNRYFRRGLILFLLSVIVVVIFRPPTPEPIPEKIGDNISKGEEILLELKPAQKEEGVKAVYQCEKETKTLTSQESSNCYQEAANNFLESWKKNKKGDPETLIYLNNAILEAKNVDSYTIAVAVPVSPIDEDIPQEILRGVAQAQTEVNRSLLEKFPNFTLRGAEFRESKSLNEKGLKVIIANDGSNKDQAKNVANTIVKRSDVLGVIGHWSSDMMMETVDIYKKNQLVIVSPGAATSQLTDKPPVFFFRVIAANDLRTEKMLEVLNKINQNRVTIFYNPTSPYSNDYKDLLEQKLSNKYDTDFVDFNVNQDNFDAMSEIEKIRKSGESVIVLIPDGRVGHSFKNATKIIEKNNDENWIVGDSSIYSFKTLDIAKSKGLTKLLVTVDWHRLSKDPPQPEFPKNAEKLWGGDVSDRTALSYDAAQVLIKGIEENGDKPTRRGIQKTLAGKNFRVEGVTGEITFEEGSGDRKELSMELVKVAGSKTNNDRFDFIPCNFSTSEATELNCLNFQ